jgi:hypothetical protein
MTGLYGRRRTRPIRAALLIAAGVIGGLIVGSAALLAVLTW